MKIGIQFVILMEKKVRKVKNKERLNESKTINSNVLYQFPEVGQPNDYIERILKNKKN